MLGKALELGGAGVQWTPPVGDLVDHSDRELIIRDDNDLLWQVQLTPIVFGIAQGEESALSEDLHASARLVFERQWRNNPNKKRPRPRTDDSSWSPIIEAKIGRLGEGRLARVVRRLSYEPGDEIIVGHLIVPVAKGTVEIRVLAQASMTGVRESAVIAKLGADHPQPQAVYDAKEIDPYFPDHPLSRVRRALDDAVQRLEIIAPAERSAEVELPEAGCAVQPPLRFTPGPTNKGSGIGVLVRSGLDDWQRLIDVWRIGRHPVVGQPRLAPALKGKDLHAALCEHADKVVNAWVNEGCTHVVTETRPTDDFGVCMQVLQYVTFQLGGEPKHTLHRWWIAGDQSLWRVGSGGPRAVKREELIADLDQVQSTFRRL